MFRPLRQLYYGHPLTLVRVFHRRSIERGIPGNTDRALASNLMSSTGARAQGATHNAATALQGGALSHLLWVGLFTVSMLLGLSSRPLTEPDEGRNAEIAREMLATGDYLLPHLNRLPHLDKPLVYHVVMAGSLRLLGLTELGARLPSAVAALLTVILTAALGRRMFGPGADMRAAGAQLVAPLTWVYGQLAILDALFTLWVVASIVAFYLAVESPAPRQRAWCLAGWACIALAILTKGPVGAVLPLIVMGPYAQWRRQRQAVFDWRGLLLAAAVVTPWVWWVSVRVPGFLDYVAVVETWQRLVTNSLHRGKPFWYFIPILLIGAFPWSAVAVGAASRAVRARAGSADPRWVLIALWIAVPLVLFSLSSSKLPHYVLPVIPAFALLVAGTWTGTGARPLPGLRGASWTWGVVGLACFAALLLPAVRHLAEPFRSQALVMALTLSAAGLAAAALGLALRDVGPEAAVWIVSAPVLLLYLAAQPFLFSLSDALSSRGLALAIRAAVPAGAQVVGAHAFPPALPFYLRRPLQVASQDGSQLTSNYIRWTYPHWLGPGSTLHRADFWQDVLKACPATTVFVVSTDDAPVRRALLTARLPLIARNAWYEVYGPCAARGELTRG